MKDKQIWDNDMMYYNYLPFDVFLDEIRLTSIDCRDNVYCYRFMSVFANLTLEEYSNLKHFIESCYVIISAYDIIISKGE